MNDSNPTLGLGRRMLTVAEVAAWFAMSENSVRMMVKRGTIPYRKVGENLRFAEHELEAWSRPAPAVSKRMISLDVPLQPLTRRKRGSGTGVRNTY